MTSQERTDPFARAYLRLRGDLASVRRQPGDQLIITEVAAGLKVSPTPVREALARLAGERLVEDRRRHGYFVPLPAGSLLRDLYGFSEMLCLAAIRDRAARTWKPAGFTPKSLSGEGEGQDSPGLQLEDILRLSSRQVILDAGLLCLVRLAPALLEARLCDQASTALLNDSLLTRNWADVARRVREIHRRGRACADDVAGALATSHRARNIRNIV